MTTQVTLSDDQTRVGYSLPDIGMDNAECLFCRH